MNKSLGYYQLAGYVFTSVFGTLLHFIYDWTNKSIIAGIFSAVNESIFEHMKLLYFPMLIFALFESRVFVKDYPCFWRAKLIGFLCGLGLIPVIYYTYSGIIGKNLDWLNILIFFIAAGVSFYIETKVMKNKDKCTKTSGFSFGLILLIGIIFIILTFLPPHIPLFIDPITKTYGINI